MSDRVFGVISLFLIVFYAWGASLTQESFLPQPVGPKVMPYILAFLGSICSIYFIVRPDDEPTWPSRYGWLEIISAILVMYAYAHLLSILGFVIASSFCASYFVWRFLARPMEAIVAGVIISVTIYIIFNLILGLSLAKGPFGF